MCVQNSLCKFPFKVVIYDDSDNIIIDDVFYGNFKSYNLELGKYKVIASNFGLLQPSFCTKNVFSDSNLFFSFSVSFKFKKRFIYLYDRNFDGLKISSGKLVINN